MNSPRLFVVPASAGIGPAIPPKGGTTNSGLLLVFLVLSAIILPANAAEFKLAQDDVVVFLGGTNTLHLQQAGYLESTLTQAFAKQKPKFRDLSWEADTVFQQGTAIERWRAKAHFDDDGGMGDLFAQLKRLKTDVVIAQFGQLECLAGESKLEDFTEAYSQLLDQLKAESRRVVLVSPTPFEKSSNPYLPDLSKRNSDLAKYVAATKHIAAQHDAHFVDLFTDSPTGLTTEDGMHIKPEAQSLVAANIAKQLGIADTKVPPKLRQAVSEKHRLWYDYWRPANWKLLFGDDARREFTRGDTPFREEWKQLKPMIARAEERVWTIASGGDAPIHERPKPEVLHADPTANIDEELAAFTVPDGFQVNLFASEADGLTSPLNLRWDPAGRMYVTVTTTYPHVFPGDIPNDKIIRLEDADRDGKADRSVVFAEGLNIPTGIEWGHGGVYVGQNTEILFLKDTDDDGKADERRVLLSGFGNGDSHQTINSFRWSPDGQLYFGHGDGCESRVETPWGASNLFNAGYYRLEPNRLKLTPFLEAHMGPGNPWGVAYDAWGQIFGVDGAGGVSWLTPGQVATTHRRRFPRIGKPGGYAGIGYLDGRGLPESMQGDFVIGDYKPNRVSRFSLEDDGAGFKLKWEEPILKSRHRNFRPIDVQLGPDGAIYVVDWYNPITCHQDDAYRHPERDKAHGRIWRVSMIEPNTDASIHPPNLLDASISELLDALKSPEYWTRYQAKRALTARDGADLAVPLQDWAASLDPKDPQYEYHLFQALSTCATNEIVDSGILLRGLGCSDPRARAFATRMLGRWHDRLETDQPLELLAASVADVHPRVRLEAVVACSQIASAEALDVAAAVIDHPMDSWIEYAFKQTVHRLKPHWLPEFKRGERLLETNHLSAILNEIGGDDVIDGLRRLVDEGDLADESKHESRAAAMAAILAVGNPEDLSRYGLAKQHFTDEDSYHSALHGQVLGRLVEVAKVRDVRPSGDIANQLRGLTKEKDVDVRSYAIQLAGFWNVKELHDEVLTVAKDEQSKDAVRAAAMFAMGEYGTPACKAALNKYAREPEFPKQRVPAIEALVGLDMSSAAEVAATYICSNDPHLSSSQKAQERLLLAFLNRPKGAATLSAALEGQALSPENAKPILRALFATGRSEPQLFQVIHAALGATAKPPEYSADLVKRLAKSATQHGDAKRGATVFRSLSCTSCHQVGDSGDKQQVSVGPELKSLGTTLSADRIIEEVLWPNRQIKEGFATIVVLTADGTLETGYERVTKRSAKSGDVLLQDVTTKKLTTIKKQDIEEKQNAPSAMPEGLTSILSEEQLFDLIRYLTELGKTK